MVGLEDGRVSAVRICLNEVYVVTFKLVASENASLG